MKVVEHPRAQGLVVIVQCPLGLGHPLGMSGARMMTMLLHELRDRRARYGLATMCIGVGQGIATIVETVAE